MIDYCPKCNRNTEFDIVKTKRGDINVYCSKCFTKVRQANENDRKLFRYNKFKILKES